MTWTPVEPAWAAPPRSQIADLHWLAYADAVEGGAPRAGGVLAAVTWVRGGQAAPVTGRDERPVTRVLAEAEMWAARAVLSPGAPPPMAALCEELGVPFRPALPITSSHAEGACAALQWLLGWSSESPLPLPVRRADGALASAQELVEAAMRAEPHKTWGPEKQHSVRGQARALVEQSRRLVARIAAAQQRAGAV